MDILGFWEVLPPDVRSFVVNLSSNLAFKLYPDEKDMNFCHAFDQAYQQGIQHFVESLGKENIPNIKPLIKNHEVELFFIEKIRKGTTPEDSEQFRNIIYKNRISIGNYHTLDQIDLKNAILKFIEGYEKRADQLEPLLLQNSKHRLDETVEYLKKILEELLPKPADIERLKTKYITFLEEKYSVLSFTGFSEKELLPIPLSEIYTFLSFREHGKKDESKSERSLPELREKKIEVKDILNTHYSVVTGGPGSGKSTLLKYITFQKVNDLDYLPIFFPISAYADACKEGQCVEYNLRMFIPDYFQRQSLPDLTPLFEDAWNNGKAIFLIDGLDEVASEAERKRMVSDIRNLIITDDGSENRYIVTCRTESYNSMARFDPVKERPFVRYEVDPFDMKQIRYFFHQWYSWLEREVYKRKTTYKEIAEKRTEKMVANVEADENILNIATNPLMLTVLALIEHEGKELPKKRADLYKRCLSMLSGQWEKLRSLHEKERKGFRLGKMKITDRKVVEYLGPVAWFMLETGALQVDVEELKEALAKSIDKKNKDFDLSMEMAEELVKILKERSGIFQEVATGKFEFIHRTFKEYLAGRLLSDRVSNRLEKLGDKVGKSEWREVVLLMFASMREAEASNFIEALMDQREQITSHILMAGECVVDVGVDSIFDEVLEDLVERLKKIAFGKESLKIKAQCAEIYGWLEADDRDFTQFIPVEGGTYDLEDRGKVTLAPFEMGKYLVTVSWFELFIKDNGYKRDDLWTKEGLKWLKAVKVESPVVWNDRKWTFPNAPVVGVSWYEADAFCLWLTQTRNDGYRYYLPTADQWQAAAAGVGKRKYPWGEWKEGISNTKESGIEKISTVGIFEEGNTPSGISDMFGNVWEWSCSEFLSWVTKNDFPFDPEIQKLWDDQNIDELRKIWKELKDKLPTLRGISWNNDGFGYGCSACNDLHNPDGRNNYVGFRCSRTLL